MLLVGIVQTVSGIGLFASPFFFGAVYLQGAAGIFYIALNSPPIAGGIAWMFLAQNRIKDVTFASSLITYTMLIFFLILGSAIGLEFMLNDGMEFASFTKLLFFAVCLFSTLICAKIAGEYKHAIC